MVSFTAAYIGTSHFGFVKVKSLKSEKL